MGLGLELEFLPRPQGLLRPRTDAAHLAEALRSECVRTWPLLAGIARVLPIEDRWSLRILPCEESVEVAQAGRSVRLSARTSSAGPGYHAFLVGILDRVAARDGGAWHESAADADSTSLDEVGYFRARDFPALQRSMAEYSRVLARTVSAREPSGYSCISLPLGLPVPRETGFLTPSGFFDQDGLRELGGCERGELHRAAEAWFPWWHEKVDAARAGIARSLLFHLPWHVPDDEDERAELEFVRALLECLPENTRFGSSVVRDLGRELSALLAPDAPDLAPDPNGFGYRRQEVNYAPFHGVELGLPGYWHRTKENPGVAGFCFGSRSLHISSYQARAQGGPRSVAEILASQRERQPANPLWRCDWNEQGNRGLAWCERRDDNGALHVLTVLKAAEGCLVHATITYVETDGHEWARATAGRIRIVS